MAFCIVCQDIHFVSVMTKADCGHEAARGSMKLCPRCARQKEACEACGKPLNPDPPPHTD